MRKLLNKIHRKLIIFQRKNEGINNQGDIKLFNNVFVYHHKGSFKDTYKEIFEKEIYKFKTESKSPIIVDCGANMGLSLLYFNINYPNSKIIAFEPDMSVLTYLKKNISSYKMSNVKLYEKAVWDKNKILNFYTDAGMGGSIVNDYNKNQNPNKIEAIRLKEFIADMHVDLLKMDIEGSEYSVIKDCEPLLDQIDNIFIEYHSFENEEQKLDNLLLILKKNGFRYHLSQSFSRRSPFVDRNVVCDKIDLAINIFAYKNEN